MMIFLKKLGISLIIVLIYVTAWRPCRSLLLQYGVKPIVIEAIERNSLNVALEQPNRVSLAISYMDVPDSTIYRFKIPAGLFFLLGCIGLIMVSASRFYYYLLFGLQVLGGLLAFLFILFGLLWSPSGFYMSEFLQVYLIPFASLALVPLFILQQKKSGDNT